jgi:hypothetical protein
MTERRDDSIGVRQNSKRQYCRKYERLYSSMAGCWWLCRMLGANMADWKDDSIEWQKSKRQKGMDSRPYSNIMAV